MGNNYSFNDRETRVDVENTMWLVLSAFKTSVLLRKDILKASQTD